MHLLPSMVEMHSKSEEKKHIQKQIDMNENCVIIKT